MGPWWKAADHRFFDDNGPFGFPPLSTYRCQVPAALVSLPSDPSWSVALLLGLCGSLGALVPTALVLLLSDVWRQRLLPYLLSYATGTMVATPILGLIPEAVERIDIYEVGVMVLCGLVLFFSLEWSVLWRHAHTAVNELEGGAQLTGSGQPTKTTHATVLLILIGDAVHNLSDGVAIGVACSADPALGVVTTLAVIGHEVPQELSDFTILVACGLSRRKALIWNTVSALSAMLGVIMAYGGLAHADTLVPYALSVAAASFLYVGLADLVPTLHGQMGAAKGVWQFMMMIAGMVTIALLTSLPH
ncbi:MAG: ZIP family metal transporter [Nitrospira sp.]|nr:ZIP family metal transporter [Nitrospira sp.]